MFKIKSLSLGLAFILLYSNLGYAASFDCNKAKLPVEKIVCEDATLSKLDDEIAFLYFSLYKNSDKDQKNNVLQQQRNWLKKNSKLKTKNDLLTSYIERKLEIKRLVNSSSTLQDDLLNKAKGKQSVNIKNNKKINESKSDNDKNTNANSFNFFRSMNDFLDTQASHLLSDLLNESQRKRQFILLRKDINHFLKNDKSNKYISYLYSGLFSRKQHAVVADKLGMIYLYGSYGFKKNEDMAILLFAYSYSQGNTVAAEHIVYDYILRDMYASEKKLEKGLRYSQYASFLIRDSIQKRIQNQLGYIIKIRCHTNTKAKTPLNILECYSRPKIIVRNPPNHEYFQYSASVNQKGAPVWNEEFDSIMYTPEHFIFDVSNGKNNNILEVELYDNKSKKLLEKKSAESYEQIYIER